MAVDLVDEFYQFEVAEWSSLFSFDTCMQAKEFGEGVNILEEDGSVSPALGEEWVFPCLATLPMGWTWALYFCHCVITRCLLLALRLLGASAEDAVAQLLVDGRPPPLVTGKLPLLAAYVDNGNALCPTAGYAARFLCAAH